MFDRVTIRVSDLEASAAFYDLALGVLGPRSDFSIEAAAGPDSVTRRLHIGFAAASPALVDRFWEAGTAAGYPSDGEPGPRPQYRDDYYGSFLLDPDGNSAEAVHHGGMRTEGRIDHLWIRVADLKASKGFYETVAARAGFGLVADLPDRVRFSGGEGSFTLVAGPPTQHLHMVLWGEGEAAAVHDPDGNSVELIGRGRD